MKVIRNFLQSLKARSTLLLTELCFFLIIITTVFSATPLSPGDLDFSFGNHGIVLVPVGIGDDRAYAVAIQNDEKIVVAGRTTNGSQFDFALARFNVDGSLDSSFGSGGKVVTPISGTNNDYANGVAIQQDNKIVAVGYANENNGTTVVVVRYNANGSRDSSFGTNGIVSTLIDQQDAVGYAVAIQLDNKIVVACRGGLGFSLVRFNANGQFDSTFGSNGVAETAFGSPSALALQSDGKIVVTGTDLSSPPRKFAVARFNSNGSLDASFDGDGKLTTALGVDSVATAVLIMPDGRIIVSGYTAVSGQFAPPDFALVRYEENGALDTTFDSDGKVITSISNNDSDLAFAAVLQSNGKILVGGLAQSFNSNLALARYNENGSLDATFSGDGIVQTPIAGGGVVNALALQSDGKIVAAGMGSDGVEGDILVARYIGDSTVSVASVSGRVVTPSGRGISNAFLKLTDASGFSRIRPANPFGYFRFSEVRTGEVFTISVSSKTYTFNPSSQQLIIFNDVGGISFISGGPSRPGR